MLGQYPEALADLELALELEPTNSRLYYFLGLTYANLGNSELAIANFELFLETNPDAPTRPTAERYLEELQDE
jgi:tetratricopeptide (TPR) repeat protein